MRKISQNVRLNSLPSPKIQKIIKEMKTALASQDDGVALAAPQIGYPLRIFVISKKVFEMTKTTKKDFVDVSKKNTGEINQKKDIAFINPVFKKMSKEKKIIEEGCLSVRFLYGKVQRSDKAIVEAYDENGKKFTHGGSGLLAQIFQHEIDHLNGILFTDKAKYVEEIIPKTRAVKK